MTGVWRTAITTVAVLLSCAVVAVAVIVHVGRVSLQPVLSGSMRPTFQPGDLVVSEKVRTSMLRVGDIVTFFPPGKHYRDTHRIASLRRTAQGVLITTKGDANGAADPWGAIVLRGHDSYRMLTSLPKLGWVVTLPRRTLMSGLLVLAGMLFLLSNFPRLEGRGKGRSATIAHTNTEVPS